MRYIAKYKSIELPFFVRDDNSNLATIEKRQTLRHLERKCNNRKIYLNLSGLQKYLLL